MNLARNKSWGYEVETQALKALRPLWPTAERTGASNQKVADDPDIISRGRNPICLIVTKEKGANRSLMIHLKAEDFLLITTIGVGDTGLAVQVKGRAHMWLDTLYHNLENRVKERK